MKKQLLQIQDFSPIFCQKKEITKTIHSNGKRSEQFLKEYYLLTCYLKFQCYNELEQIICQFEQIIGDIETYMNKLENGFIYLGKSMSLATISCQFKVIVSFKNIPEQNCSVLVPRLNSKSVKDIQMLRKVAQMTAILTIKSSFI